MGTIKGSNTIPLISFLKFWHAYDFRFPSLNTRDKVKDAESYVTAMEYLKREYYIFYKFHSNECRIILNNYIEKI